MIVMILAIFSFGDNQEENCNSSVMRDGNSFYNCEWDDDGMWRWDPDTGPQLLNDCDRSDTALSDVRLLPVGPLSAATQPTDGTKYIWYQNLPENIDTIVSKCSDDCDSSNTRFGMGCDNCDNRIDQYGNICYVNQTQIPTYGGMPPINYYTCDAKEAPSWEDKYDSDRTAVLKS